MKFHKHVGRAIGEAWEVSGLDGRGHRCSNAHGRRLRRIRVGHQDDRRRYEHNPEHPPQLRPRLARPDVFYGNEGLEMTTSCYDGLLRYKDNTTQISPRPRTSCTISSDVARPTRSSLRHNVKFSDGTPFNSAAMAYSMQRRLAVNGGPAYMVKPIASMDTSNPNVPGDQAQGAAEPVPGRARISLWPTRDQPDGGQGARGHR